MAYDDNNKIIRYLRKDYKINIRSLIDEDYQESKKKGMCGSSKSDDLKDYVPEGSEIEAVQQHLRERVAI
jgi:hypothetical protein